jgi:hypothetical protein
VLGISAGFEPMGQCQRWSLEPDSAGGLEVGWNTPNPGLWTLTTPEGTEAQARNRCAPRSAAESYAYDIQHHHYHIDTNLVSCDLARGVIVNRDVYVRWAAVA